jgi:hypothetical protein
MVFKVSNYSTAQNFPRATNEKTSDNSYVLRKMLLRGSMEADYRYRLYEGDRAFDFKRLSYQFDDLLSDLDNMFDDRCMIRDEHCITLIRAIQNCQDLLALDQAETSADYRNLMAYLTGDLCPACPRAILAA